jgi:hypothetical protein
MDLLESLKQKLARVEALHARPGTEGERLAAALAKEKLQDKLEQLEQHEVKEIQYYLSDRWSKMLFMAICAKYGQKAFRYKGQRRTTANLRATSWVHERLWKEYLALNNVLDEGLGKITSDLINTVVHRVESDDVTEIDESRLLTSNTN